MSSGSSSTTRAEPLRVLAVLPELEGGGAQRVMLRILRELPRDRFAPELVLLQKRGVLLDHTGDLEVFDLGARAARFAGPSLLRLVWRRRPQVVFSTIYYVNLLVLLLRPFLPRGTRVVVREAITLVPAMQSAAIPRVFACLHRALYRFADAVVVQCDAMARDLSAIGVTRERMVTIYNPVDVEGLAARARGPSPFADRGPGPHVVTAGRLVNQKGIDRLLRAVPQLRARHPGAQVWILGDDPGGRDSAAARLDALRRELGLEDCVHFVGYRSDLPAWLAHADLFVLASRYEGLPNVLLEALACGCSVVALEGEGGTREILERCGLSERWVARLEWPDGWLTRPEGPPDLTAFSVREAVERYGAVLAVGPRSWIKRPGAPAG